MAHIPSCNTFSNDDVCRSPTHNHHQDPVVYRQMDLDDVDVEGLEDKHELGGPEGSWRGWGHNTSSTDGAASMNKTACQSGADQSQSQDRHESR
jgi:hypothetical protein